MATYQKNSFFIIKYTLQRSKNIEFIIKNLNSSIISRQIYLKSRVDASQSVQPLGKYFPYWLWKQRFDKKAPKALEAGNT